MQLHVFAAIALTAVAGAAAEAQPATPTPQNDATLSVGGIVAKYSGVEIYDRWHKSLYIGAGVGHYWTEHFKSDVEAVWLSPVVVRTFGSEVLPNGTAYYHTTMRFQDLKVSVGQNYQFGKQAWAHPYLGAGVDVDYLRSTENRPAQVVPVFQPGLPGPTSDSSHAIAPKVNERITTLRARPFVNGGVKMYLTDRVFFRTEGKMSFGDGVEYAVWKAGFGVDF